MVPHIINHPERLNQHKTTDTTLIAAPSDRVRQQSAQGPTTSGLGTPGIFMYIGWKTPSNKHCIVQQCTMTNPSTKR